MAGLEGKEVTIFYDDNKSVSRKDGTLVEQSDEFVRLHIKGRNTDKTIAIPVDRIVRIESDENG